MRTLLNAFGCSFTAALFAACGTSGDTSHTSTEAGDTGQSAQDSATADGTSEAPTDGGAVSDATMAKDATAGDAISAADANETDDASFAGGDTGTTTTVAACLSMIDAGATCNALQPQGPTIVATCSDASAPQPMGGTIVDGTYVLQSMTIYGTCPTTEETGRFTWLVCGDVWTSAQETPTSPADPDAGVTVIHVNASVAATGSSLAVNQICAAPNSTRAKSTWNYDVTSTGLVFYLPYVGGSVRADAFVRQ